MDRVKRIAEMTGWSEEKTQCIINLIVEEVEEKQKLEGMTDRFLEGEADKMVAGTE